MAGAFDEWAAARTPSLLRFAHALTEDRPAAEAAVEKSLARIRRTWAAIDRDGDPDLAARRFVVDASPGRGRAAVVLRVLEDRSDEEIAEVLGTSRAFARTQVQRQLATLHEDLPAGREGMLVGVLERQATLAPSQLTRPLVAVDLPGRRRGRPAWLAAAAVLLLVVTVALVARATRTPAGVISYPSVQVPTDWRYESYAGVQVRVPATWGFGGAPVRADFFQGRLAGCGSDRAAVPAEAAGASYASSETPFTGRPAMMSYACGPRGSDDFLPRTDAVWFGSPLAVGVEDVGSVTAETRAIGGQHVTVFSRTSALRRQVLGTAQVVAVDGNGCPTQAVHQPQRGAGDPTPSSMSVCVYSQDTGTSALMWSGRLDAPAAQAYVDAVQQAASPGRACNGTPSGRWVALGVHGDGGTRWDVVDLECAAIEVAGGAVPLTPATVGDWAHDGVTAYAIAGSAVPASVAPYFHPAMS